MTVVLQLTDSRITRLGYRIRGGDQFTVTIPEQLVDASSTWRLCLLLAEAGGPLVVGKGVPSIIAVARLRGSGRPTTTDERVTVAEPHLVDPPLPLREFLAGVPSADRAPLRRLDTAIEFHDVRGEGLIQGLLALRPDLAEIVTRLSRHQEAQPVTGTEGETLAFERDAVHLALSIAGFDLDDMATWTDDIAGGYLSKLAYVPREEVLSGYDADRFPGWQSMGGTRPDWTLFSDGQHQLRVGNANATKLERVLGVDLIYRHIDSDTFVLVQYKKMTRGAAGSWGYRPDGQLDIELERMRRVDAVDIGPVADPATWRLYEGGCFLKLVRPPASFDPTSDRLLSGIYLPVPYLDDLIKDLACRGDGRHTRLGYDTVDRYLTAGLFVELVRQGWIGTRGLTTRAIEVLVESAIGEQRSVLIAEEVGEQAGSERRRRPRAALARTTPSLL